MKEKIDINAIIINLCFIVSISIFCWIVWRMCRPGLSAVQSVLVEFISVSVLIIISSVIVHGKGSLPFLNK